MPIGVRGIYADRSEEYMLIGVRVYILIGVGEE